MNIIKNLHLVADIVDQKDMDKMEHGALQHRRYSNVTFKIIEVNDKKVTMQVAQGKSSAQNYHTGKRLIEMVHETFDRFFPGRKIIAGPIPYQAAEPNQVTHEWIHEQMKKNKIRLKRSRMNRELIILNYLRSLEAPLFPPL